MKCPRCDCENTRVTDTARSYRPASTNRKYMVDRVKQEGRVRGEWKANFNNRQRAATRLLGVWYRVPHP